MDGYGDQIPYIPWHSGTVILNASSKVDLITVLSICRKHISVSVKVNTPVNYIQPWYMHDMSLSRNFHLNTLSFITPSRGEYFNQQHEWLNSIPCREPPDDLSLTL